MITMRNLVNTLIISHSMTVSFFVFDMVRALKIYSLRNFQVYNMLLLTVVIMFITSPGLIYLTARSLYPLTFCIHLPPASPGKHQFTLFLWAPLLLWFHVWVKLFTVCLSLTVLFHLAQCSQVPSTFSQEAGFSSLYG